MSGGSGVAVGVVVAETGGGCHYDGLHEELRQPVANVIKKISLTSTGTQNKLDRLSFAFLCRF